MSKKRKSEKRKSVKKIDPYVEGFLAEIRDNIADLESDGNEWTGSASVILITHSGTGFTATGITFVPDGISQEADTQAERATDQATNAYVASYKSPSNSHDLGGYL